jgi:hypothetical protein
MSYHEEVSAIDKLELLLSALDDAWEKSVWTEPLSRAIAEASIEEASWHPA